MGKASFGWKDNEHFLSLLESEYLRGIHREMSDVAENQKYKAEVWVKNSGLDSSLGIRFLESWKEMRLHRERGKKAQKTGGQRKYQEEKWTGTETLSDKRKQERLSKVKPNPVNFVSCK